MNEAYEQFIESKSTAIIPTGIDVDTSELNPMLFEFQKDIVKWALKKGKAAIFADCGDGKTAMQLEWAEKIRTRIGGKVLIIAPLAVSQQTEREGEKFGVKVNICADMSDVTDKAVNITNYEKLGKFKADEFVAVILDESSIIKSYSGKIRNQIIEMFVKTPYKLACTATPAPNDYMELGNHSEFLGVMTRSEMIAMYFVHDGGQTSKWRLKGHARQIFWKWLSSWCVMIDDPKKLGYKIDGYDLPKLNIHEVTVDETITLDENLSLTERRQARRDSLEMRCTKAAEFVNNSSDRWLVWCDLNDEANLANKLIKSSVNVQGSDSDTYKAENMLDFANGNLKCLITKPKIAGYGMNWQGCHKVIFLGLSDSFEMFYQAVRRCWRFGQKHDVDVYIIISYCEKVVLDNIRYKQNETEKMKQGLLELTRDSVKGEITATSRITSGYNPQKNMILPKWSEFE